MEFSFLSNPYITYWNGILFLYNSVCRADKKENSISICYVSGVDKKENSISTCYVSFFFYFQT